MPPLVWTCNPASAIPDFESRHKNVDAGALFAWAQYTVESLHYLDDTDRAFDSSHAPLVDTTLIWLTWPMHVGQLAHVLRPLIFVPQVLAAASVDILGRASSI